MVGLLVLSLAAWAGGDEPKSPVPSDKPPEAKKVEIGKNVFLEVQGEKRRVLINAVVCLTEGQLEQLMCRRQTKEHEAILSADVDARDIHKALLVAGAKTGSTVKYEPKYLPPTGSVVKVSLQYESKGKTVTVPAQQWVQNARTKKDLDVDWVFAGSQFITNPDEPDKPPFYLANDGDVICVSNFDSAMLDLPIVSPKDNAELVFIANTPRIPPKETKVLVILEPVPDEKKKDK
jgi:hypothetical protein